MKLKRLFISKSPADVPLPGSHGCTRRNADDGGIQVILPIEAAAICGRRLHRPGSNGLK